MKLWKAYKWYLTHLKLFFFNRSNCKLTSFSRHTWVRQSLEEAPLLCNNFNNNKLTFSAKCRSFSRPSCLDRVWILATSRIMDWRIAIAMTLQLLDPSGLLQKDRSKKTDRTTTIRIIFLAKILMVSWAIGFVLKLEQACAQRHEKTRFKLIDS